MKFPGKAIQIPLLPFLVFTDVQYFFVLSALEILVVFMYKHSFSLLGGFLCSVFSLENIFHWRGPNRLLLSGSLLTCNAHNSVTL